MLSKYHEQQSSAEEKWQPKGVSVRKEEILYLLHWPMKIKVIDSSNSIFKRLISINYTLYASELFLFSTYYKLFLNNISNWISTLWFFPHHIRNVCWRSSETDTNTAAMSQFGAQQLLFLYIMPFRTVVSFFLQIPKQG